tara:strand:- start:5010 stop:5210 length:201 start_codon:yes stop_codon:yes gene_type:complete
MGNPVLDSNDLKNILFDVLDGVPASENESKEASVFREEIEKNNRSMEYRAEELGLKDVLDEFPMNN